MTCDPRDRLDVLISGYASIDTVYRASAPPQVGATSLLQGPVVSLPRCGGCGPAAALALAHAGCRAGLLSWLGDDPEGQTCLSGWTAAGIDVGGVVIASGQASPRCFLFYDPNGGATCYYHPSGSANLRLMPRGREMVANAGAMAVTVGPATLTEALLAVRRPEQPLAWNVKADPHAFPPELRARLVRDSAVICLNRDELRFVASAVHDNAFVAQSDDELAHAIQRQHGGIVVVTAGAAGCHVVWSGGVEVVPAVPVQVADPTGAGDAFFGAFVAAWLHGAEPAPAASSAARHVATCLRERAAEESEA